MRNADVMHRSTKLKTSLSSCHASCPHRGVFSVGIACLQCFCSFSYQIEGVEGYLGPGDKAACIPAGMPDVPAKSLCFMYRHAHHQ